MWSIYRGTLKKLEGGRFYVGYLLAIHPEGAQVHLKCTIAGHLSWMGGVHLPYTLRVTGVARSVGPCTYYVTHEGGGVPGLYIPTVHL